VRILDHIRESNRIEGIEREPTTGEVQAHIDFLGLDEITIADLERFVSVYQPGAVLRLRPGMNVRVGAYYPPEGGEHIREQLQALLDEINAGVVTSWHAHLAYEALHPFTDGNGRSGRMLWYWMVRETSFVHLGFLHSWYYQTLAAA